jgi:small redox-active disulfide protein 2
MLKMKIEVFGPGCPKCKKTEQNARTAAQELSVTAEIIKVTDVRKIAGRGVMLTPALAIDGELKIEGRIPTVNEISKWLGEKN